MGGILNFLLENFIFIIILYGIISSFFGKGKEKKQDTTTKGPYQPKHTPVEMERTEKPREKRGTSLRDIMEQMERELNEQLETRQAEETARENARKQQKQEVLSRYEQERKELELAKERNRRAKEEKVRVAATTASINNSPIYSNDLTKSKMKLSFDQQSVTQGIIYSEILSKPRALRPYQRGVKK